MPAETTRGTSASLIAAVAATLALLSAGCGEPEVVAVVDGFEIGADELEGLHPVTTDLGPDDRAGSVYLLVLHRLLVVGAEQDFAVVIEQSAIDEAFSDRTQRFGDEVDDRLSRRGVTRDRVLLEAELDVIRTRVEDELVRRGDSFDLDAAYRQFISTNSTACLVMLAPTSPEVEADIAALVETGVTLETVEAELPEAVERVDLGCTNPFRHITPLQPVAVDGEVGRAYLRTLSDGTVYVAGVTERDAPALEDVMEEVLQIAANTQGPDLFEAWAVGIMQAAEVEVDPSIGTWTTTPDSSDIPTVVTPEP